MGKKRKKAIDIALQGGGSHGAFTWGVLDRLLQHDELEIEGVSGTSAGAMNAVAVTQGLAEGGPERARELLAEFWTKVSEIAATGPIQRSVFDRFMGRWSLDLSPTFIMSQHLTRMFSPYELNPFNINPLRDIVADFFDFDIINRSKNPKLFLSATNVRTGRTKIFRQPEISADAAMASACLPFLFKAVEIDGEAYWDGGFMGNPPLFPLIDETEARDIVVIQVNPFVRDEIPRTAYEIENRLNEITFNASLMKELRAIGFLWELIHHEKLDREAYRDGKLHLIGAEEEMLKLSVSSKLNAERAFLDHLWKVGWETADAWLEAHFEDIGERGTWRPGFIFEESLKPAHLDEDDKRGYAHD
ncbi:MAG: patatin-like phospholipase family protein [Alphaproteobacteria bacterium]|nr:patatin-like phospholipase family protein [Alphaproteobacteria bacterium]